MDATGTMIEVAGSALPLYERENEQPFSRDRGLAVDDSGNLLISNIDYNYVRRGGCRGNRKPRRRDQGTGLRRGRRTSRRGATELSRGFWRWTRPATSTSPIPATTHSPGGHFRNDHYHRGDRRARLRRGRRLAARGSTDSPIALAMDGAGNLYVADLGNYRIRVRRGLLRLRPLPS